MENYKLELMQIFKHYFIAGEFNGFCSALYRFHTTLFDRANIWNLLCKYKPEYTYSAAFWFKPFEKQPRIELLDKIIEDLKNGH